MWMSDARVICAVWGCARCLWFVCVFGLSVCFGKSVAPLCLQRGLHLRPSVLYLFTLSVLPFVNGTIHPLSYLIHFVPYVRCLPKVHLFTFLHRILYSLYFLYFLHSISSLSIR